MEIGGGPVTKFQAYIRCGLFQAFMAFCDDHPTEQTPGAILAWMALDVAARESILRISWDTPVDRAVKQADRIIRDVACDRILLEWARSLPKAQQMRIIKDGQREREKRG
jgi:hypothetical protein